MVRKDRKVIHRIHHVLVFVVWTSVILSNLHSLFWHNLVPLRAHLTVEFLLEVLAVFQASRRAVVVLCLPGRCAKVRNTVGIFEHGGDLFEGLTAGLREQEENVKKPADLKVSGWFARIKRCVFFFSFSTYMATQKIPKSRYTFHLMLTNAGGTKYPRAKLKAQFPEVASATALPRTRLG